GLMVSCARMDAGAMMEFERLSALRFLFVLDGRGDLDCDELRKWSAVRLNPGAGGRISALGRLKYLELAVQPVT
ncbi:MAG: hypothetical protein ACXU71_08135, partial [Croceibacterium sp.]